MAGVEPEQPGAGTALDEVEVELADVERALRRLDDGTYGTCEACGGAIADEDLAARPAARLCAEHAEHAGHTGDAG